MEWSLVEDNETDFISVCIRSDVPAVASGIISTCHGKEALTSADAYSTVAALYLMQMHMLYPAPMNVAYALIMLKAKS